MTDPHSRAGRGRLRVVTGPVRSSVLRLMCRAVLVLLILGGLSGSLTSLVGPVALAAEEPEAPVRVRGAAGDATADPAEGEAVTGRPAPAALPRPEGTRTPEPDPTAGEAIVANALTYVGYPYVAGGNSPAGFDCSGFTQFIVLITLGVDIGHGLPSQTAVGPWVEWGTWQPGDLVFFANTYKAGLSHVGIYVGDGLFVHAGDQATGVLVSSMYEEYYASRYYGAVRVA
jgi:cell wall-associated NlpC family hydrolase